MRLLDKVRALGLTAQVQALVDAAEVRAAGKPGRRRAGTIKSAKAKGRRVAGEVRDWLLETFPDLEPEDVQVVSASVTGVDVLLSPRALAYFPFTIECKCQERLNIWSALKQAEQHQASREGLYPVVFFRRNNSPLYMALSVDTFQRVFRGPGTRSR